MSDPDIVEILRANCTGDCVNVRSIDLVPCYVCEASNKIEELQEKNEWLESHVGALIIVFRENKAEIERLRAELDRWRNVADELVKAADIQVHLSSVPHRYPWYSQHLKDALAQYKEAQK